jgi:hypothetical protein
MERRSLLKGLAAAVVIPIAGCRTSESSGGSGQPLSRARHWWIRTGTLDTNTAHTVVANLAAKTASLGDDVNSFLYWDGGHAVNEDAPEFVEWVADRTGYTS